MVNNRISKYYQQVDSKINGPADSEKSVPDSEIETVEHANSKYRIVFERFDPRIIQNTVAHSLDLDEDGEIDGYVEPGKLQQVVISQDNQLLKSINFWIGHLNFYLTSQISEAIERTEGIESFDVITPYRFRIGVGKLFSEQEVKQRLIKKIIGIVKTSV